MIEAICPGYKLIEFQEHVRQCNMSKRERLEFAKALIETLLKNKSKNAKDNVLISFVEDIMKYA